MSDSIELEMTMRVGEPAGNDDVTASGSATWNAKGTGSSSYLFLVIF